MANNGSLRCPLSGGGHAIDVIPELCLRTCETRWEQAFSGGNTAHEVYPQYDQGEDICSHPSEEYSHSGLQSVNDTPRRIYAVVRRCDDCDVETGETTVEFSCPVN